MEVESECSTVLQSQTPGTDVLTPDMEGRISFVAQPIRRLLLIATDKYAGLLDRTNTT